MKTYYNDKHKSQGNISYRSSFIKRYFAYELRAHRWIQLPLAKYKEICEIEASIFSGTGYSYLNDKNEPFIEFHIDDNEKFKDMITNPFGGNLSVRIPTNQLPLYPLWER